MHSTSVVQSIYLGFQDVLVFLFFIITHLNRIFSLLVLSQYSVSSHTPTTLPNWAFFVKRLESAQKHPLDKRQKKLRADAYMIVFTNFQHLTYTHLVQPIHILFSLYEILHMLCDRLLAL